MGIQVLLVVNKGDPSPSQMGHNWRPIKSNEVHHYLRGLSVRSALPKKKKKKERLTF